MFLCITLSLGQTWNITSTMIAVLSDGVFTVSTTANAEPMPDYYLSTPWSDNRSDIRSVVIEKNITSIGKWSFSECSNLISVTMSSVTAIEEGAFFSCSSLTSIPMSNVTTIGDFVFYKCEDIASVTMPNVTTIGVRAFEKCSSLISLTMPNVTAIEPYAFTDCSALTSVTMPNVITIGHYAFTDCFALTSLTLPASVHYIHDGAFQNCTGLKNVSVAWISPLPLYSSFLFPPYYGIDDLWGSPLPFSGVNTSEITLHVPSGTKARYAQAGVWKDFGTIVEYTVGNETIYTQTLKSYASNNVLYISGLRPNKPLSIYSINGQLVYQGIAKSETEQISFNVRGVYIVVTEKQIAKVVIE